MVLFIVVHNIGVVVVVDVGRALLKKVVLAKVGLCCVFIVLLLLMILLLLLEGHSEKVFLSKVGLCCVCPALRTRVI